MEINKEEEEEEKKKKTFLWDILKAQHHAGCLSLYKACHACEHRHSGRRKAWLWPLHRSPACFRGALAFWLEDASCSRTVLLLRT